MQSTNYNGRTYYLFDTFAEFVKYIKGLSISRGITRLQVHHTSAPSYDNWATDIELRRIRNTVDYHKKVFGTDDIAQHFTIFPNGKIATGRSINRTPIGIKGWNTGAICCEIYGNFDSDVMKAEQKKAIIGFYGELCKLLDLKPSVDTIRYHCWFDANGNYLGGYDSGKSCKTCPGKKFFGGNTQAKMKENFLPEIKAYLNPGITEKKVNQLANVNSTTLNVRKGAGTSFEVIGQLKHDEEVSIVATCSNGWVKIKYGSGYGYVNGSEKYLKNRRDVTNFVVRVISNGLNIRTGPDPSYDLVDTITDHGAYTIVEVQKNSKGNEWGKLKSGLGWICIEPKYVERL